MDKKVQVKIDLKKLPTIKKIDPDKEEIITKILIDENRLALRYLQEK
ncbi:hypothetical protein [Fusobacterium sp.]|nr:hypothetical protein [Fusobacterium sp.]